MTTLDPTTSDNYAVIVGVLDINPRGRNRRSALRATITEASMELVTPFGEPFALPLTLASVVENSTKLVAGRRVAVEGQVRMERGFDRRYAHEDDARGAQTRSMQFIVHRVREAGEDEPSGSSFVSLVGTVLDPPQFVNHPQLPAVRLALVRFGITQERPSPYPGSQIVRQDRHQVNVAVAVDDEHAGLLYRPGNRLRIQGELDCVLVERQGRSDEEVAAVQRVRAQWEETRQQLRSDPGLLRENPRAEEQAYGRYLGQLRRLRDTPSWRVLAGYIQPAGEAEPLSQGQARRLRQQWSREQGRGHAPERSGSLLTVIDEASADIPEGVTSTAGARRPRRQRPQLASKSTADQSEHVAEGEEQRVPLAEGASAQALMSNEQDDRLTSVTTSD